MTTKSIALLPLFALLAFAVGCSTVAPKPAPVDQPIPTATIQEPVAETPAAEPKPTEATPEATASGKPRPPKTAEGQALASGAFSVIVIQRTDGPWREDGAWRQNGTRERLLFSRLSKRYDGVRQIMRASLPTKILKLSDADFWPAAAAHLGAKKIQAALVVRIAVKKSLSGVNERKREQGIDPQDAHVVWKAYRRDGAALVPSAEGDSFVDSATLDAFLPTIADAVLGAD